MTTDKSQTAGKQQGKLSAHDWITVRDRVQNSLVKADKALTLREPEKSSER